MTRPRPLTELLQVFIGPGLWFAHFSIVYGAEALICRDTARAHLMVWTGAAATLAALVVLALMLVRRRAENRSADHTGAAFLRDAALLLVLLSMLGVAWTALPLVLVKACTS